MHGFTDIIPPNWESRWAVFKISADETSIIKAIEIGDLKDLIETYGGRIDVIFVRVWAGKK